MGGRPLCIDLFYIPIWYQLAGSDGVQGVNLRASNGDYVRVRFSLRIPICKDYVDLASESSPLS